MKKLAILALLSLLGVTTKAHGLEGMKCTHDDHDNPAAEETEVDEDFSPNGDNNHEGRTLASYSGMRTYGYYGAIKSNIRSYYEKELIPPVIDYLRGALKVKYPISGNLKFSSGSLCGVSTPSALRSGVAADFAWVIQTDSSGDYVANTYTCNTASGSKRPIAGRTVISTRYISKTSDVLLHEKSMICMIHEVVHALGFSRAMYPNFVDSNGKRLSGHIKSAKIGSLTSIVIDVPVLTNKIRNHFGCSSAKGAYMENTGGSATGGSHFERRHYGIEAMTSGLVYQQPVSEMTLGLLEASGWFVPDYSYADNFNWGKDAGCTFLTGSCSPSVSSTWCSSSARSCTDQGRGGGSCSSDTRSDGCKYVKPSVSYDCDNANAKNSARLPNLQTFGRGKGSKCFTGTLSTSSGASQTTYCFKPTCTKNGSNYSLNLSVGGKNVACTKKGQVSVSGYKGYINCPDPNKFCTSTGHKSCPRGCMGRGTCVDGFCQCRSGYKGADCALNN